MRNRIYLAIDVVLGVAIVFVAYTARFDGLGWWPLLSRSAITFAAVAVPIKIVLFYRVGLYRRLWRYASIADLETLLIAGLLGTGASFMIGIVLLPLSGLTTGRIPVGILVMDSALTAAALALPRLLPRVSARRARSRGNGHGRKKWRQQPDCRRVLIAGAGDAGGMIAKEMLENPQLGLVPVGFIDDDSSKHGHDLHGIPVLGPLPKLGDIVAALSVSEVIIALPSARGKVIREIVRASAAAGVLNRTVPGLFEILSGAKAVSALRPIEIQDLLRRDPIETNLDQVGSLVRGRTVLV
ncbi:MAG: nucleoside-diphosphate sugar epimerase/dehydratase, partial [bacterium]